MNQNDAKIAATLLEIKISALYVVLVIKHNDLSATFGKPFDKRYFIATSSLVYHSPIGPVAISLNYFDNPNKEFSFSFNLGYIIFNKKATD